MRASPIRGTGRRAGGLVLLVTLGLATLAAAATPTPPPSTPKPKSATRPAAGAAKAPAGATRAPARTAAAPQRAVGDAAREARELEDAGAYTRAAEALRALRRRVAPDADLELALALDEARIGRADSAWARLQSPLLTAVLHDSLPLARRREYPYQREFGWLNGRFDGWHWYVWRARAELAARMGRWDDAHAAALECVAARPQSGKDWAILAVTAARVGKDEDSRQAIRAAATLDPMLPEARYMLGLWEWRDGRRNEAQGHFRQAVALDSSYALAALALMRSRLPGAAADSMPAELLTGPRRVALITAPERPKPEEFVQVDVSALLESSPDTAVTDSIPPGVKPLQFVLSILVDDRGRPVVNDFPWFPPGQVAPWKISRLLSSVPSWRFTPAVRLGAPHPVWVSLDFYFTP